MEEEKQAAIFNESSRKGHIKIDWGRQGGVIAIYIIGLLGYYGLIANTMLFDQYGHWVSYVDMDRTILFWTWTTYLKSYFLPALVLFGVGFLLTYKEDIPHYGIKATIWLVPFIIAEGFIFYAMMFGFSLEPLILKFGSWQGYLDIIIMFALAIIGAVSGMKLKQYTSQRKSV